MERENYYLMLELPIDPPASDPGEIRAAINKKKQEWVRWQDHPGKRTQALRNLELLPEIERVMFAPAERKQQARKALAIREEMMRRFVAELRILEGKGHLFPREVSAVAAKYREYGITQQDVLREVTVPVAEHPPTPEDKDEDGEVIDRLTAKNIGRNLELVGKADLYAFLGEPNYSSIKKLQTAAELRRRAAASAGAKTAQSVASQELAGLCLRLFESFDTKQLYDRYLKISGYPSLNEMVDEEFTRARYISPKALLRLVNYAVETQSCKVLEAEEHIRRYCEAYRIPLGTEKPMIVCPACKEQVERESVICQYCAAPLQGDCPSCGTPFRAGAAACQSCGFLLKNMAKAIPHLDAAQGAILDGSWSKAQRSLAYVEKYWPGHPELVPLKKRARDLEEKYSWYVDQVNDCLEENRYYAALALLEEAEQKGMPLPAATGRQVHKVLSDLEKQLEALATQETPDIQRLMELSGTVTDSLELARLLARNPPKAPEFLRTSVQGRKVHLYWDASDSPGKTEYVLVRKEHAVPATAYDGDILYSGPANSFTDRHATPLKEYQYKVFARRGNTYAPDGPVYGPLLIVPEIEQLRILPADQGAQLSWAFNADVKEVRIWRKLGGERPTTPGEGVLIETTRIDGFVDSKIKNDVEYWYYLVAVYVVDGREVMSKGVCEMITPHKILSPIDRLRIAKSGYGDNEFVVNWDSEQSDLILLASPKKPDFKLGDVFPVQELLSRYRNLSLHARTADSGRFRYSFVGGIYVFAAVIFGRFAAVGAPYYLTNLRDVEELTADLIGQELFLNMRWPLGLTEIAVTWKRDGFPRAMDELGVSLRRVTREEYDYNAGVILRDIEPGSYYFKVYALFQGPDGKPMPSEGAELLFTYQPRQEVFYRLAYKHKRRKAQAELEVTLSSPQAFVMPKAVIVSQAGRLPLNRSDGQTVFELDQEARVNGEVLFQYQMDAFAPDTYLRLFFQNDESYERFRLTPGSQLKLTD